YHRMYQSFIASQAAERSDRGIRFNEYVLQQGEALVEFSLFESKNSGLSIDSASDPRFHQYLQWLAHQQLARCQQNALGAGMRIGLMRDLAVGAVRNGAEVQNNAGLYCDKATIGAPPDPLAEQGQNWDLPALDPVALKNSSYRLFIELLRSNMTSCGGLRIDHILGLLRLWWCHPMIENGAYVYYPFEDLIAILCLESHRHSCLIVGEDMGTVPDELRRAMKSRAIYSNKLFYFEKGRDQAFKNPSAHERDALLMVTNHDVPTLAGWWEGMDLRIRREIGLLDSERQLSDALEQRNQHKANLLGWLNTQQLLPKSWGKSPVHKEFDFDLCSAIILANAKSQSRMVLFQLDDLQLIRKPVNIPGTYKQYPNWRRKQKLKTRNIFGNSKIQQLMSLVQQERKL
ncbi:MAG: 4-alpha-glucanotransferase, partial [Gammaproteobacteria bacterium]|nr:4-alpha-glucanotransferase [Gammaproteobacteria bacterium]